METKKWYVGQQVWDKTISDEAGKIISINDVQLVAKFFRNQWAYSLNGELIIVGRHQPTLSTKPYEIKMEGFSQEVEKELPKKGQIVWGRHDVNDTWSIGHFIKKEEDLYFLSEDNDDECFYPIKEITTKNPYEVEEDREPQIGDMCFFWDVENPKVVACGELGIVYPTPEIKYVPRNNYRFYKHCSLKNPLIK